MEPKTYYYQLSGHNLAAATALPILDMIAVLLRFYARKKQRSPFQADDWLTIPAVFLAMGTGAAMITGIALHGPGYPVPAPPVAARSDLDLINKSIVITSKVEYAIECMAIPALLFTKLSILFFYKRIFCSHGRISNITWFTIHGMIVIVAMWGIAFFFEQVFACGTHFGALWGSTVDLMTKCVDTLKAELAMSMSDFITDVLIILLPLPMLWKLQLPWTKKVAVTGVFLLGSVAVAASATRLAMIARIVAVGFDPREDEDLVITGAMYWLMVELYVGILAACLPTIRIFFKGFSPESVISGIRSAFSLRSLGSNHSRVQEIDISMQPFANDTNNGKPYTTSVSKEDV